MEADDSTLGTLVVVNKSTFVEVALEATGTGTVRTRSEPPRSGSSKTAVPALMPERTGPTLQHSATRLHPNDLLFPLKGVNPNDLQYQPNGLNPNDLLFQPYRLNPDSMLHRHLAGTCEPCLYFTRKQDGCWRGDECDRCHFCSPEEAKARRAKMSYAKKKARKAAAMQSGLQENAEGA
mmetsp:Transcript_37012/g.85541  ORF Transcript_37012/g.85541 Transcript_37012/m.85541 type:complete len:179 (+) Transcript_37012:129-665(+)